MKRITIDGQYYWVNVSTGILYYYKVTKVEVIESPFKTMKQVAKYNEDLKRFQKN